MWKIRDTIRLESSKYSFNSKSINFSCFVFRYNRGAFSLYQPFMYCHLISNINIAYGWIDANMTNCKKIVIKHSILASLKTSYDLLISCFI